MNPFFPPLADIPASGRRRSWLTSKPVAVVAVTVLLVLASPALLLIKLDSMRR